MSTNKPATPKPAATPKARKPKGPSMSTAQKFDLLNMIRNAPASTPDATLAEQASAQFGRKIVALQVSKYRKEFGIASVGRPKAAAMQAYVDVLTAALVSHGIPVPEMGGVTVTAVDPATLSTETREEPATA